MDTKSNASARLEIVLKQCYEQYKKHGYIGYDPSVVFKELKFYKAYEENQTLLNNLLYRIELGMIYLLPNMESYLDLIGAVKVKNNYGLSFFIQAFVKMQIYFGEESYLNEAKKLAASVIADLIKTPNGLGMANPPNLNESLNGVAYNQDVALIPSTAEFVFALIDLYNATKERQYLDVASEITNSFAKDYTHKFYGNGICIDYSTAKDHTHILNANALAAKCICLVSELMNDNSNDDLIRGIHNYLKNYIENIEIPYCGKEDSLTNRNWNHCDLYHTGFTLRGVEKVVSYLGDEKMRVKLNGIKSDFFSYFLNNRKIVKMRDSKIMDIHAIAEYVLYFSRHRDELLAEYLDVVIDNINSSFNGKTFFYRKVYFKKINCYMPRWGHAPMMNAMAELLLSLKQK